MKTYGPTIASRRSQSNRIRVAFRLAWASLRLLVRLLAARTPDVYLVSYPGWFDIPLVKLVSVIKRRPVLFDVFISLHDTAIDDRGLAPQGSLMARLSKMIDKVALRLSDRVIADCATHASFLAEISETHIDKFGVLYLGADEQVFSPAESRVETGRILFIGTFVPLQGVEVIVRAASLLQDRPFHFRMVGSGQTEPEMRTLADELQLTNIEFVGRLPQTELAGEMGKSELCLGVFSSSPKANRVVPHKVYEAIACARPVVTGRTSAVSEVFTPEEVVMVPVDSPDALASAIADAMTGALDIEGIGKNGHRAFRGRFSREAQSQRLFNELEKTAKRTGVRV